MSKDMDQLSRRLHHLQAPGFLPGADRWLKFAGDLKVKKPSAIDAAYIAGLIDGEGTVTLTRRHRNENRQLCVTISSTERQMLEFVRQTLGAGKITNKSITSIRHAPSYTYTIANRQALELLRQIEPWLKSYKRLRASLILRDYVRLTPRNGKYSPGVRTERKAFEQAVLAIKANGTPG